MTSPARAFLATGTPGLARLPALVFFLLIGFALPQPAAAQNSAVRFGATWTISDADPVDEGSTAEFEITLNRTISFAFSSPVTYTAESAALTDLGSTRPTTLAITNTDTTYTIEVPIEDDDLVEGEETFTVTVSLGELNEMDVLITATGTINASDGGTPPPAVAPAITTQPTDQSVTVGENATFTVTATGTPTPTYQWRFEGSDIAGATSASYTLSNAALTNAGDYTVVVTNTAGTVTSSAATLTVTAAVAPQITTQPTNQSVTVGETATFTVAATGTPTPTYQWRKDGTAIAGATSASYAISSAALTDAGSYTVVVTNSASSVTSTAATLTVTAPAGPDLTVDAPTRISSTPSLGVPFEADVTVRNQGTSGSAATVLRYFISSDATITTADTELTTTPATLSVGALSANGQQSISAVFSISTAGASWVGTCVTAVSGETNTNNNCSTGVQIQVADQPDLTVRDASVSSASVATGTSFTINATVHNIGSAAAAATTLTYYRSTNQSIGTSATSIGTDSVSALAASGSSAENISVSIDTVGTYWVGACVATLSDEANLENNCSTGVQVTITDPPTVLSWDTSNGTTFSENGLSGIIRLIATPPVDTRVNFSWSITPGNEDGVVQSLSRTTPDGVIGAGADGVSLVGSLTNDNIVDAIEYVDIAVTSATRQDGGVVTFDNSGGKRWSVTNDDATVVSISPTATVAEGGLITFTVNLSHLVAEEFELAWTANDGTGTNAATVADDLEAQTGRVTIPENRNSATFQIQTSADTVVEADEVFTVTLTGAALGLSNVDPDDVSIHADNHTATGTITDADTATVSLSSTAPPSASEGGTITFTVDLDNSVAEAFSLGWAASNGTATVADDLDEQSGTVDIPANARTATFDIAVTSDDDTEGSETFTVALTGAPTDLVNIAPSRITVDSSPATGTINANDNPISIGNRTVAEASGSIVFTVSLEQAVDGDVELDPVYARGPTNPVTLTGSQPDLGVRPATVFIDEGQTEATLTVPINEDTIVEGNETFTVTLYIDSAPTGVIGDGVTATGTITDSDTATVSLSSTAPLPASEGGTITFTVELDNPVTEAFSLGWAASNGTATVANDLDEASGTVEIPANARTATFDIAIIGDDGTEGSETFTVALTGAATGLATIAPNRITVDRTSATGTINASTDQVINTVSIGNASAAEASGSIGFTVRLKEAVTNDVELEVTYAPGSTNSVTLTGAQADLGVRTASVGIDKGDTETTFTVPIENDEIVEGNETFTVTILLDDPVDDLENEEDTATGTITDSDTVGVSLSSTAPPAAAEGGTITFTVELDNPVAEAFSLGWAATNGTATVADDLDDQSGTVKIPANARTATFTIPITNDTDTENSETFTVALTGTLTNLVNIAPSRITVDRTSVTGTINANDNTISIGNRTVAEASGSIVFTVSLDQAVDGDVELDPVYAPGSTNSVTLTGSQPDLGLRPATVFIDEGQTETTLTVPINEDTIVEGNETFTVTLYIDSAPAGVTGDGVTATGTITDSDTTGISLSSTAPPPASEGETITFTVELDNPVTERFSLGWTATNGTATVADDLDDQGGAVEIPANARTATFDIPVTRDDEAEGSETFTVALTGAPTGLVNIAPNRITVDRTSATGTINASTAPPPSAVNINIAPASAREGDDIRFRVTVSPPLLEARTLNISYTAGSGDTGAGLDDLGRDRPTTLTLSAGTTRVNLDVPTFDDSNREDNETFTVNLSLPDPPANPRNTLNIITSTVTGTIRDNDNPPPDVTVSIIAEKSAVENAADSATFTVRLSQALLVDVTLAVAYAGGTNNPATPADDLGSGRPTTVTINRGTTAATLAVPINDDTIVEGDETFTVTLSDKDNPLPDGVTIGNGVATNTIGDDDEALVTLSPANSTAAENRTFTYTVSLSAPADEAVTVRWTASAESGDTATVADDLQAPRTSTVTFDANDNTAQEFSIAVNDDTIVEGDETFTVTLSDNDNPLPDGVTISNGAATNTIRDDDEALVTLSPANSTAAENGTFTYTVSLSAAADEAVTVRWTASAESGDTATVADDLQAPRTSTVTFNANDNTAQEFSIAVNDDDTDEPDETFTVTLSPDTAGGNPLPTGVTIGTRNRSTATITDDDAPPEADAMVRIGDRSVLENVASGSVDFTVSLDKAVTSDVTLAVAYAPGTDNPASLADDLGTLPDTIIITEGNTEATLRVPVSNDALVEEIEETFTVTISEGTTPLPDGVTIRDGVAIGTIEDNDTANVSLSPARLTAAENGTFRYNVRLSAPASRAVNITWNASREAGDTATLVDDLDAPRTGTLSFPASNNADQAFSIAVTDDDTVEENETFTVTIRPTDASLPSGVEIDPENASSVATITDNDEAVPEDDAMVGIADRTVGEAAGNAVFTVTLSRVVTSPVRLAVAVTADTATLADLGTPLPTTVTINANTTEATLTVPVINDPLVEGDETFTVTLSEGTTPLPEGVSIGTGIATGTITDDDRGLVSLDPPTLTAAENGTFTYTVRLSAAADESVNITWTASSEANDTATVADDLQQSSGTVTFDAGSHVDRTFSIAVTDDDIDEDNETFTVTLTPTSTLPTRVIIPATSSTSAATITDNDDPPSEDNPTVRIGDRTVSEASGIAVFTVTLSAAVNSDVVLAVAVTAGTATLADDLGAPLQTMVTINEGETRATITVPLINDSIVEDNETFTVTIREDPANRLPADVTISDGVATGTITSSDTATLMIVEGTVNENDGTALVLMFLSAAVGSNMVLDVAYAPGVNTPATLADDLGEPLQPTVLIVAGTTRPAIAVPIINDNLVEDDETFTVTIRESSDTPLPNGVTIINGGVATVTIIDNDQGGDDVSRILPILFDLLLDY